MALVPGVTVSDTVVNIGGVVDPDVVESISNWMLLEMPPPGAGVCTVMFAIPAVATSDAGTWAVSWTALTYCVVRAVAPQYTVELGMNPEPFTVSVKAVPPMLAMGGVRPITTGTGLLTINITVCVAAE